MTKVPSKKSNKNTARDLSLLLTCDGITQALPSQQEISAPFGILSLLFRSEYDQFFPKVGYPVDFPPRNHAKFEQMSQYRSSPVPAQAIASSAGWQTVADLHSTSLGSLHDMINLPRPIDSFRPVTTSLKIHRIAAKVTVTSCLFPDRAKLCLSHTLFVAWGRFYV